MLSHLKSPCFTSFNGLSPQAPEPRLDAAPRQRRKGGSAPRGGAAGLRGTTGRRLG